MDTIEAGGLSVHFFRPGNKITEAVIVFDYRIVLFFFDFPFWFIGSHISDISDDAYRK